MGKSISSTTVELQIALNKKMYEIGQISYDIYSKANEILNIKLTYADESDMIVHSEMK